MRPTRLLPIAFSGPLFVFAALALASGQSTPGNRPAAPPDPVKIAGLLETGHCTEAWPLARKAYARAADPDLKHRLGAGGVRCAMSLNQTSTAAELILMLNRDFPKDPDVLYLTVHTYSDLSVRASQTLLFTNPGAYHVHQLNAEAMEIQGKWDEAAEEYRMALKANPALPGIHYRLGRVILSKPETPTTREEARKEFEEELRNNPSNAGAEFVLAELARQAENYQEAIDRFTRATKLDAMFADAYIGLGRSLLAAEKAADAIHPLEQAVQLQPDNPTAHFLLANAYRRAGRQADADRETEAHRTTSEKARQTTDDLKKAVTGTTGKAQ
jgi:tetratricopeptide (TPR) repeat protein